MMADAMHVVDSCTAAEQFDGSNERSLAEEGNEFTNRFSGTLSFDEDNSIGKTRGRAESKGKSCMPTEDAHNAVNEELTLDLLCKVDKRFHPVTFEVMNADIVGEGRDRHVSYTILLIQTSRVDGSPARIQRRYSDFEKLNTDLKRKYQLQMQDVAFPRKMLYGNFKPQNIARRSRAFEQFLAHVYSVDLLRVSSEFASFFYLADLHKSYTLLQNGKYADALVLLQSSVRLQRKLYGDGDLEVVATLCALVCCCDQQDQKPLAQSYSELALGCIGSEDGNKFLVPLLQLATRICWKLGKDKTDLEEQLQSLRNKGINVDTCPSLLEMVIAHLPKH